ncbi:DUF4396 domain-containing protein [Kineococcus auxinigenes]|uniref:DUF4396 domain-containing protein n=1 Tax=unclassified Kineococcus TaxID=2621656 RepID=UPI003D7C5C5D
MSHDHTSAHTTGSPAAQHERADGLSVHHTGAGQEAHTDHEDHSGHETHAGHDSAHGSARGATSWAMAAQATLHCLTGCAIGEVLGMVIGTALGWSTVATIALAVALAFVFGYALTMRGVLKAGVDPRTALKVALAADTVSIAVMEIIDNTAMLAIPGAMHSGVASWIFWASLAGALALAFVITTPINRWMISRGKGHAVVHAYHH